MGGNGGGASAGTTIVAVSTTGAAGMGATGLWGGAGVKRA
jgi:hypothetical protein